MKKQFLFNPNNPKKSFDVYIDKNPKDSIPIKYSNKSDVTNTIKKLEKLYKSNKYPHKRISQVAMILMVRTRVIKEKNPKIDKGRANLSKKYFDFLKERTKLKNEKDRKKLIFSF
jgi:hypothetical protein